MTENEAPKPGATPETETPEAPTRPDAQPAEGERIAKAMARAGVASRREAERMILEGRVKVNGRTVTSPALDILPTDKVLVDGKAMDAPQETRLWLYYKPVGLVTTESDEKGRQTVFDALPRDLPRVMTVGRLDLNSEGLLLLTNDGELKRRLELPSTGWLRRYRVRVNGQPTDLTFDPLRRGVTIDGEDFAPMEVRLDSQQGANAWLTVGIREGRNREIRRAMSHVGLQVNRLIRIGYGPFKLTGMEENEVKEVRRRILRDQLGGLLTGEEDAAPRRRRARPDQAGGEDASVARKPRHGRAGGDRPAREDARPDSRPPRGPRPPRDEARPFRAPRRDDDAPRQRRGVAAGAEGGEGRFSRKPREEGGAHRRPHADRPARESDNLGESRFPRKPRFDAPRDGDGGRERSFARKPRAEGDRGGKPRFDAERGGAGPARRDRAPRDGERPERKERSFSGPRREAGARDDASRGKSFGKPGSRPFGGAEGRGKPPSGRPPRTGAPGRSGPGKGAPHRGGKGGPKGGPRRPRGDS